MPVQRRSQGFLDLSASFQNNPLSNDLITLKNENAIARSVRNLILTTQGERPFQPVLGSNVNNLLFENMDKLTAAALKDEIRNTIENYEPRVEINEIIVEQDARREKRAERRETREEIRGKREERRVTREER